MEAANCSPQAGLSLVPQTLNWLPSIPWDLSYHAVIPMMFTYSPELSELHSWGAAGDGELLLDNHAPATNLLSHKLACMHGEVGPNKPSLSRVASPTSSAALHSPMTLPASSRLRTPSNRTNIVRSHSNSASSPGSQRVELKLPAGSGYEGSEDSKSTSQDDSNTNEEGRADSRDKAPGDGECQDGGGSDTESSSSSDEEAEGSISDTRESHSQSSYSSLKLMVRFWPKQAHQQKRPKETHQLRRTRQMT